MLNRMFKTSTVAEDGTETRRKPSPFGRLFRLAIIPVMACGILALGSSAANAAVDPGGSGASSTTALYCNNRTHQLTVRSRTYNGDQTIMRRLMWAVPGGQWTNFAIDGQYWTSPGNDDQTLNMTSVAGMSVVFTAEYAFQPAWVSTYWNLTWERPAIFQWFSSGGWRPYSTCNL